MSSKLSNIADKFAMKLGLESRPSSSPMSEVSQEIEILEPAFDPVPDHQLSRRRADSTTDKCNDRIDSIRANMHVLTQAISFKDYNKALQIIHEADNDLFDLRTLIKEEKNIRQR